MSKEFVALYNAAEDLAVSQLEGEEGPVRGMEHMQKMRKLVLDAWDDLGVVDGSRTEEQDAEMILLFERTFWGWRKEAGGDEEPSVSVLIKRHNYRRKMINISTGQKQHVTGATSPHRHSFRGRQKIPLRYLASQTSLSRFHARGRRTLSNSNALRQGLVPRRAYS